MGLVIAVILAATMSSSSGEINSLATVSVVDIYKRHFRKGATDRHYLTGLPRGHGFLGRLRGGVRRARQSTWDR